MKTKKTSIDTQTNSKRHGLKKSWRSRFHNGTMTVIAFIFTLAPVVSIWLWAQTVLSAQ